MRISDWSSDVCSSDLEYTPHIDTGDYIVIVNAEKVKTTGNKLKNKIYYRHTEYPGGIRSTSLDKMLETHPERVLEKDIKGMLPRGPLGYAQFRKLKVFVGSEHPHPAQQTQPLHISSGPARKS